MVFFEALNARKAAYRNAARRAAARLLAAAGRAARTYR